MSESSGFQKYSISWVFQALFSLKPLSISTKYNQPIYYEDAPVSCRLCLMMGGGVLIKICSKAVRSHLHFWWSWWWWWWWQWWRTLSHIDAQKPIYGIKCLWEFGCTPGGGCAGRWRRWGDGPWCGGRWGPARQDKQPLVGNAETSREPSRASGNYKPAFIEVVIV